jgi:putative FmdB family regulatory protein
MPIFEFLCADCGSTSEVLIAAFDEMPSCKTCGSANLKKLLSATSTLSGPAKPSIPGPSDTTCCGSSAANAGCGGPGSCCGKNTF